MFWNSFLSPWATTSRMSEKRSPIFKPSNFFFCHSKPSDGTISKQPALPLRPPLGVIVDHCFFKRPLDAACSAIICSVHVQSYFDRTDKERLLVMAWNYIYLKQWILILVYETLEDGERKTLALCWQGWSDVCLKPGSHMPPVPPRTLLGQIRLCAAGN